MLSIKVTPEFGIQKHTSQFSTHLPLSSTGPGPPQIIYPLLQQTAPHSQVQQTCFHLCVHRVKLHACWASLHYPCLFSPNPSLADVAPLSKSSQTSESEVISCQWYSVSSGWCASLVCLVTVRCSCFFPSDLRAMVLSTLCFIPSCAERMFIWKVWISEGIERKNWKNAS